MSAGKLLSAAPLGVTSAVLYGMSHAPKFTLDVLAAAGTVGLGMWMDAREKEEFNRNFTDLLSRRDPWRFGPSVAELSQRTLRSLPTDRPASVLVDPYYFNPTMTYTDENLSDGNTPLYLIGYRLHPCAVYALNYHPLKDTDELLITSVVLFAFLRGTTLRGDPILLTAIWQEGLPLGAECPFGMPKWGILRRADTSAALSISMSMAATLDAQCVSTDLDKLLAGERINGYQSLPTMIERGFPDLQNTVWFGVEPFPALETEDGQSMFEYELIGADFRQKQISVPIWFRPRRGELG